MLPKNSQHNSRVEEVEISAAVMVLTSASALELGERRADLFLVDVCRLVFTIETTETLSTATISSRSTAASCGRAA